MAYHYSIIFLLFFIFENIILFLKLLFVFNYIDINQFTFFTNNINNNKIMYSCSKCILIINKSFYK